MSISIAVVKPEDCFELLEFELQNKDWFEQHIAPRDEDFYCLEGVQTQIKEYRTLFLKKQMIPMLVRDAEDSLCGRVNIHRIDLKSRTCEIGYRIGQSYCRRGIASKALKLLLGVAAETGQIDTVHATVLDSNLGSVKVLEKNGFIKKSDVVGGVEICGCMHPASLYSAKLP